MENEKLKCSFVETSKDYFNVCIAYTFKNPNSIVNCFFHDKRTVFQNFYMYSESRIDAENIQPRIFHISAFLISVL